MSDRLGQRAHVPRLIHAHAPRHDPQTKRRRGRESHRQSGRIVPPVEAVVGEVVLAEDDVLAEQDDEVARAPVAEQGEEVGQIGVELLAAAEAEGDDGGEAQKSPDEARDAREGAGELLARDGGAVDGDDVGVDAGEDEEGQDELGEAARVQEVLDQEAEPLFLVGGVPLGFVVEGRGDDAPCDHADGGGDRDAKGCHEEDLGAGDVGGVVHVVIGRHGAPGGTGAVDDGQEGENGAGEG